MQNPAVALTSKQIRSLESLAQAHDRLVGLIGGLEGDLLTQCPVMGDWTVKDLLGHIVSWNREFRAEIQAILSGLHPGFERIISGQANFDEWNQQQASRKRNWSWERIRADLDQDLKEIEDLIRTLTPQDFRKRGVTCWKRAARERPATLKTSDTDSVETLVNYHWRHMNAHAREIDDWLKIHHD